MGRFLLIMAMLCMCPSLTWGAEPHVNVIVHGANTRVNGTSFGIAGILVASDVTNSPEKWSGLVGPRYDGEGWFFELMLGAKTNGTEARVRVDTRLMLGPEFFKAPVHTHSILSWTGPSSDMSVYLYQEVNYVIPWGFGKVGVETENVFKAGTDIVSVGAHLAIPLGQLTIVPAYQLHWHRPNQFWVRLIIKL